MPFSRDPRMERRRRVLREPTPDEATGGDAARQRSRSQKMAEAGEPGEASSIRRGAGYSQDVRKACQHRIVQMIPVRRRAFLAACAASVILPAVLLSFHYLIYVNGYLPWYGHPLAVMLDASHPRSVASWLSSHLWLLCLAATVLTFRLRRHKLDDYEGDYRLWFWLVSTCLAGSLDSTTRLSDLFGDALDRWCQLNLGWSGDAVVQATLATLIGMLGLRLCSELKSVPTSLCFWLLGLVAWAGSAALSQSIFKLDMTIQLRIWLRAGLWLLGLTSIWLAALAYLRNVYIEAQRRFLLRGSLSASVSTTLRDRLASAVPTMPSLKSLPKLPRMSLRRGQDQTGESEAREISPIAPLRKSGWSMPNMLRRRSKLATEHDADERSTANAVNKKQGAAPLSVKTSTQVATAPITSMAKPEKAAQPGQRSLASQEGTIDAEPRQNWLGRMLKRPKFNEDAPEYRKPDRQSSVEQDTEETRSSAAKPQRPQQTNAPEQDEKPRRRGWLPRPTIPKLSLPKPKIPKLPRPKLPKLSMPKFSLPKLPSLRLKPPDPAENSGRPDAVRGPLAKPDLKPVSPGGLPSTQGPAAQSIESDGRPLSKAERKRLKRQEGQPPPSERRAA